MDRGWQAQMGGGTRHVQTHQGSAARREGEVGGGGGGDRGQSRGHTCESRAERSNVVGSDLKVVI